MPAIYRLSLMRSMVSVASWGSCRTSGREKVVRTGYMKGDKGERRVALSTSIAERRAFAAGPQTH